MATARPTNFWKRQEDAQTEQNPYTQQNLEKANPAMRNGLPRKPSLLFSGKKLPETATLGLAGSSQGACRDCPGHARRWNLFLIGGLLLLERQGRLLSDCRSPFGQHPPWEEKGLHMTMPSLAPEQFPWIRSWDRVGKRAVCGAFPVAVYCGRDQHI